MTLPPEDTQALRELMTTLRLRRRELRLTQAAVAQRMGISRSRVSTLERADPQTLPLSTFQNYARALGTCVEITVELPV